MNISVTMNTYVVNSSNSSVNSSVKATLDHAIRFRMGIGDWECVKALESALTDWEEEGMDLFLLAERVRGWCSLAGGRLHDIYEKVLCD